MAIDATYVNGQSVLSQDKSAMPDAAWINGLSGDTYWVDTVAGGGLSIPVAMHHYQHNLGR